MDKNKAEKIALDYATNDLVHPSAAVINSIRRGVDSWFYLIDDAGFQFSLSVEGDQIVGGERSELEFEMARRRLGGEYDRLAVYGDLQPGGGLFERFLGSGARKIQDANLYGAQLRKRGGVYFATPTGDKRCTIPVEIYSVTVKALEALDAIQIGFDRMRFPDLGGVWLYVAADPKMAIHEGELIPSGVPVPVIR